MSRLSRCHTCHNVTQDTWSRVSQGVCSYVSSDAGPKSASRHDKWEKSHLSRCHGVTLVTTSLKTLSCKMPKVSPLPSLRKKFGSNTVQPYHLVLLVIVLGRGRRNYIANHYILQLLSAQKSVSISNYIAVQSFAVKKCLIKPNHINRIQRLM